MNNNKRFFAQIMNKTTAVMLCVLFIFLLLFPITATAAESKQKTVRVGFYPCPFNIKDESGFMRSIEGYFQ